MRDVALEKRDHFNLKPLFELFLKAVALFFIAFTIRYWLLAIGYPDTQIRFDTMVYEWQLAVAVLSVVQPVVAVGLWSAVRWGYVVWSIAVAIELIMYGPLSQTFGTFWSLIYFHVCTGLVMGLYLLIETLSKRRTNS